MVARILSQREKIDFGEDYMSYSDKLPNITYVLLQITIDLQFLTDLLPTVVVNPESLIHNPSHQFQSLT